MEALDERELRAVLLRKLPPPETTAQALLLLNDANLSWEQKRPLWNFLLNSGREQSLIQALELHLQTKQRVPFDLLVTLSYKAQVVPEKKELDSLVKGLKKQRAFDDLYAVFEWDNYDPRLPAFRDERRAQREKVQADARNQMREKFLFLRDQRLFEQAGRLLKRLLEIYPEEAEFRTYKAEFDEIWAREVLSNFVGVIDRPLEHTVTEPSSSEREMLKMFLLEGEKRVVEYRDFALDLAVAFWFLEDYEHALQILPWAPPNLSCDWLKAETLFAARRFVEGLEHLARLEIKYVDDAETTFAVSYMRAQCLQGLGQASSALEIMRSIVQVRPQYRSAHALILQWAADLGAGE